MYKSFEKENETTKSKEIFDLQIKIMESKNWPLFLKKYQQYNEQILATISNSGKENENENENENIKEKEKEKENTTQKEEKTKENEKKNRKLASSVTDYQKKSDLLYKHYNTIKENQKNFNLDENCDYDENYLDLLTYDKHFYQLDNTQEHETVSMNEVDNFVYKMTVELDQEKGILEDIFQNIDKECKTLEKEIDSLEITLVPYTKREKRRRDNFSKPTTKILRNFLDSHKSFPYANKHNLAQLSRQTGLEQKQIRTWLTNNRRRYLNYQNNSKNKQNDTEEEKKTRKKGRKGSNKKVKKAGKKLGEKEKGQKGFK
ncbi:homeobox protein transcription factor [Anaeramoeba flamelloides]|uniref:Homeobox protein transcription factor n=1 Tax=Anaeramoeba flamelloides TaxID=1746091 RepID=A0ABQ8YMM6_9EUKA|nr:homeobox protein transcription factor [Anaeramoeba flamelloides]